MSKLKKISVAVSFLICSFVNAQESLPVQGVGNEKEVITASKLPNLTEAERRNIKEIYDQKIESPQFELGLRYYAGSHGLDKDFDKAVYWFANSSQDEQNPNADMMLASMYYEGQSFTQNTEKAINFYTRAATRGSLQAQLILTGIYFFNSEHMNQEYANYWIYKSIENKGHQAELLKGLILLKDNDYKTIEKMIPAYEQYSLSGSEFAQFTLGYLYFTGKGVKQDFLIATKYLSLSAANKNPISIVMLDEINKLNFNELKQKEEETVGNNTLEDNASNQ